MNDTPERKVLRLNVAAFDRACKKLDATTFRAQSDLLGVATTTVWRARGGAVVGTEMANALARTFGVNALPRLLILS